MRQKHVIVELHMLLWMRFRNHMPDGQKHFCATFQPDPVPQLLETIRVQHMGEVDMSGSRATPHPTHLSKRPSNRTLRLYPTSHGLIQTGCIMVLLRVFTLVTQRQKIDARVKNL